MVGQGVNGEAVAVGIDPPMHFVQIVEVSVRVTVETVLVVTRTEDPPVVMVLVTGQVVSVVYVMTVVVESSGVAGVEPALTPAGAVIVAAGVDPAGVTSGIVTTGAVDVEVTTMVEMVLEVVTIWEVPEVIVAVTGHSVVVV